MPGRRLLILDDDEAVGQTIQWIAEGLGFEAEFVTDPRFFFERLEESAPEVITIDLVMPTLDGVEIMRLLAERKCKAKIVISSGMGTRVLDAAERSATQHGLDIAGVISKPISKEALRKLIGEGSTPKRTRPVEKTAAGNGRATISRAELEGGLERQEFVVFYQPKVDCKSGVAAGFEALVRLR